MSVAVFMWLISFIESPQFLVRGVPLSSLDRRGNKPGHLFRSELEAGRAFIKFPTALRIHTLGNHPSLRTVKCILKHPFFPL